MPTLTTQEMQIIEELNYFFYYIREELLAAQIVCLVKIEYGYPVFYVFNVPIALDFFARKLGFSFEVKCLSDFKPTCPEEYAALDQTFHNQMDTILRTNGLF